MAVSSSSGNTHNREDEYIERIGNRHEWKKKIKQSRNKKQDLNVLIKKFGEEAKLPAPKCISDRTLLYMRYLLHETRQDRNKMRYGYDAIKFTNIYDEDTHEYRDKRWSEMMDELDEKAMMLYTGFVRGEMKYINSNPLTVAAAIVYLGGLMVHVNPITHAYMHDVSTVSAQALVRMYRSIYADYRKLHGGVDPDVQ